MKLIKATVIVNCTCTTLLPRMFDEMALPRLQRQGEGRYVPRGRITDPQRIAPTVHAGGVSVAQRGAALEAPTFALSLLDVQCLLREGAPILGIYKKWLKICSPVTSISQRHQLLSCLPRPLTFLLRVPFSQVNPKVLQFPSCNIN